MSKAMILAAGLGTRLRPLTLELPKPLVWVGDRPAIAHITGRLVAAGVTEVIVNTHHRAGAFSAELLARVPGRLSIVHEPDILGTGGGVANAAPLLGGGDVLVWNGDILAPLDVPALLGAHRGDATMAIAPRRRGEGTVGVDAAGRVVRLRGEHFGDEVMGGDFLGVYVLGEALRRALPKPGCLVGDGLLPLLRRGGAVMTFKADIEWDDIGSLEAYRRANERWLAGTGRSFYVGEGVEIESGVDVTGSIVLGGARVQGVGHLRGCIVWPGGVATAPLSGAVVTTEGRVVPL